jgi:hypothetical protein
LTLQHAEFEIFIDTHAAKQAAALRDIAYAALRNAGGAAANELVLAEHDRAGSR